MPEKMRMCMKCLNAPEVAGHPKLSNSMRYILGFVVCQTCLLERPHYRVVSFVFLRRRFANIFIWAFIIKMFDIFRFSKQV